MATLPTDMITRILSRLPVKKLVSFKCVSKPWNSLIQDSDFAKHHLHHSFKTNANVKLIIDTRTEDDEYKAYSVDFDSLGNLEELPRPYADGKGFVSSRIFGSCNGLLAVWNDRTGIALWNPSTGECNHIPELAIGEASKPEDVNELIIAFEKEFFSDNDLNELIIGFGYDIVGDDYKVVQMLSSGKRVMIYSLKSNSWKRIEDCPYQIPYNVTQDGVYSNGCLHWVGDEKDKPYGGRLLFGLDLGTEEFHRVPEPDTISDKHFAYRSVGVLLGGSLCVFTEYANKDHVILWAMKEYGVKQSWTELVRLSREEWWRPIFFYTKAIACSRKGDRVLLEDGGRPREPAWYDIEKKTREILDIPGAPGRFSATVYVESLVSVSPGSSSI